MFSIRLLSALLLVSALVACTTRRESNPQRTATEQLLISAAADRAAEELRLDLPQGSRVFVDSSNIEGLDAKYAVGVMRERVLELGGRLVPSRGDADVVVEVRMGALSIDESKFLLGIPEFSIPIPASDSVTFPELALFKRAERRGVAKFAGVGYDAKSGELLSVSGPQFGFSHETRFGLLLFFSWERRDFIPEDADRGGLPVSRDDLPRLEEPSRQPQSVAPGP